MFASSSSSSSAGAAGAAIVAVAAMRSNRSPNLHGALQSVAAAFESSCGGSWNSGIVAAINCYSSCIQQQRSNQQPRPASNRRRSHARTGQPPRSQAASHSDRLQTCALRILDSKHQVIRHQLLIAEALLRNRSGATALDLSSDTLSSAGADALRFRSHKARLKLSHTKRGPVVMMWPNK